MRDKQKQNVGGGVFDHWLTPKLVVLAICLTSITIMMFVVHHFKGYSSDDVAWQSALLSWRPFSGDAFYGGSDPFIIKIPLYAALQEVFELSRRSLLLTSLLLAWGNFVLFYFSALYFLKRWGRQLDYRTLLPFVWLASFGFWFTQLFLVPNLRNIELGAMFVLFMLVAKVYYGEIDFLKSWRAKLTSILTTLLVGLLICNDLFFLYFGVLPIMLFCAYVWWRDRFARRWTSWVIVASLGSVVVAEVCKRICVEAGIVLAPSVHAQIVPLEQFFANIPSTIHSTLIIFGADFFDRPVVSIAILPFVCNAALLGYVVWRVWQLKKRPYSANSVWPRFFALLCVGMLLVVTISTVSIGTSTYRYLILLPYFAVLFLCFQQEKGLAKRVVELLLVVASVANLLGLVLIPKQMIPPPIVNKGNADNFLLIRALQAEGVHKGYAQYWDSTINTYLSKGDITVVPVVCDADNQTKPIRWLIAESQITKPADRSFIVYNPLYAAQGMCNPAQLTEQFGEPAKRLTVQQYQVLIYDRDVLK